MWSSCNYWNNQIQLVIMITSNQIKLAQGKAVSCSWNITECLHVLKGDWVAELPFLTLRKLVILNHCSHFKLSKRTVCRKGQKPKSQIKDILLQYSLEHLWEHTQYVVDFFLNSTSLFIGNNVGSFPFLKITKHFKTFS